MKTTFDVIIIGGSYAGLAAGMALGRSLRHVLIIDGEEPCNKQTPHSHNFLTQDGNTPQHIATLARQQVEAYSTVTFFKGIATKGIQTKEGFEIQVASGEIFTSKKIIFATGIKDKMPDIPGFKECWGISVIHCPYCHGYEVKHEKTGILIHGEHAFDFTAMISHWTKDLTLYVNAPTTFTNEQLEKLKSKNIPVVEKEIESIEHENGKIKHIRFKDGSIAEMKALYGPRAFEQHCSIPEALGCELDENGYIKADGMQKTTVDGVFACGDSTSRLRTVANAVATGATAGMMLNREMIMEAF